MTKQTHWTTRLAFVAILIGMLMTSAAILIEGPWLPWTAMSVAGMMLLRKNRTQRTRCP